MYENRAALILVPKAYPLAAQDATKLGQDKLYQRILLYGSSQAKPDPYVVNHRIEHIQHALDIQTKGVSAKKVVITL